MSTAATKNTIGARIRLLRTEERLTQAAFGSRIGVKKAAVSNIENERTKVSTQMARSIIREFNLNENWLLKGEGNMHIDYKRIDFSEGGRVNAILKEAPNSVQAKLIKLALSMPSEESIFELEGRTREDKPLYYGGCVLGERTIAILESTSKKELKELGCRYIQPTMSDAYADGMTDYEYKYPNSIVNEEDYFTPEELAEMDEFGKQW